MLVNMFEDVVVLKHGYHVKLCCSFIRGKRIHKPNNNLIINCWPIREHKKSNNTVYIHWNGRKRVNYKLS